jgi:hypothetical protein
MEKTGKYLTAIGDRAPAIMCESHAKVFEETMITAAVPHTIYELDDDDGPYYCHACDLQKAKEHVKRRDQVNESKIILPGQYI